MNKFEKLLQEAEDNNVKVYKFNLGDGEIEGLYMDGYIALSDKLQTTKQKACVLAEELGHHYTTVGNILDQNDMANSKQERAARGWAYTKLVPLENIRQAYGHGYIESYDIAEYLDVDEGFLKDSLEYYREKFGETFQKEKDHQTLDALVEKHLTKERT